MQLVRRLTSAVARLQQDAENAVAVHATLMHANESASLREVLYNTRGANAYNVIHSVLLDELLMILMRMHDAPSRRGNNRASLPSVLKMLGEDGVTEALIARRPVSQNARKSINTVHSRWATLEKEFNADQLPALRNFRDRYVAHALYDMPYVPHPEFGYWGDLLDATLGVIAPLCLGVLGDPVDFQESDLVRRAYAGELWGFVEQGARSKLQRAESSK